MPPRRLMTHPSTTLERGPPVTIRFDGAPFPAYEGEPVAAALYACNRTVLSRSMRYHRARGLFCGTGSCTHCFLRIDGVPNQRSCDSPCSSTTWAEGQNALPNVRFDALAAADLAFPRYLDAHSSFIRPRFLKPIFDRVIRAMAGFGRVPKAPLEQRFRAGQASPDVLVVGAGPAGLAAAESAARHGASTLLAEAEDHVGGRLRELTRPFSHADAGETGKVEGKAYAAESLKALTEAGARVEVGTRVFATYGDVWAAATSTRLLALRPRAVVLATGALDAYEAFPGSDRAGVLLATAGLRLLNRWGIVPPEPILIYGATRAGLMLALDLVACGARVAGVIHPDPSVAADPGLLHEVEGHGVPVRTRHRAAFVAGRRSPTAVVFDTPGGRVRIPCKALVCATGRTVLSELVQQAGGDLRHDAEAGWLPVLDASQRTSMPTLYAAGACAGARNEWDSVLSGRRAGEAAAGALAARASVVAG